MASNDPGGSSGGGGASAASGQSGQGASFGDALGGFSTGAQLGSSIASFIGQQQAARVAARREKRAYHTSLGVFQDLLGQGFGVGERASLFDQRTFLEGGSRELGSRADSISAKGQLAAGGSMAGLATGGGDEFDALMRAANQQIYSDQLVQPGSYESNFLAEGSVVARRPGDKGMDPKLLQARSMLFALINRGGAIRPGEEQSLQLQGAAQVGAQLQGQQGGGNLAQQAEGLQSLGGAGISSAQTGIQTALTNRAFSREARNQSLQFIQSLYGTAGSVF